MKTFGAHLKPSAPYTSQRSNNTMFQTRSHKNRQLKTSFISTPRQKSQKTLCNKQCKHFRPRCPELWKECVCLYVGEGGGGGIWCVSVLVERAVSIYIYKNILIISLASRCKAFPPPQVGFDNCFLILVLNLVIKTLITIFGMTQNLIYLFLYSFYRRNT